MDITTVVLVFIIITCGWIVICKIIREYLKSEFAKYRDTLTGRYIRLTNQKLLDQIEEGFAEVDYVSQYDTLKLKITTYSVISEDRRRFSVSVNDCYLLPETFDPENPVFESKRKEVKKQVKRMPRTIKWALYLAIVFLIWDVALHINDIAGFVAQTTTTCFAHPAK